MLDFHLSSQNKTFFYIELLLSLPKVLPVEDFIF